MKNMIILLLTFPFIYYWCGNNKNDGSQQKNGIELQQNSTIKLTDFKNGRWISTTDSLSGIEIKNGMNSKNIIISQFLWYLKTFLPKKLGGL